MAIGFVPMLFFMPFIKKIVGKFGKKEASAGGAFASIIGGVIMLVFPLISNKALALVVYMIALVIFGLGLGIYTCVSWAFMADAIDYNEWKTGSREEGTVYALHSFFRKLAQGVGPAVALVIMTALGYVGTLGADQTPETALNMRYLVAALYLLSAVMQFVGLGLVFNLNKKNLAAMQEELKARHAVKG